MPWIPEGRVVMATKKTPRVQALAGLAVYASLMEVLLKRGITEQDDVGAITKEAATNVAGFCTGFGAEVERKAQHLLTVIGNPEQKVEATLTPPISSHSGQGAECPN
jgi:hypothetical protein